MKNCQSILLITLIAASGCGSNRDVHPETVKATPPPVVTQASQQIPSPTQTPQNIQPDEAAPPVGFYRDRDGDLERIPERRPRHAIDYSPAPRDSATESLRAKIAACDVQIETLTQEYDRLQSHMEQPEQMLVDHHTDEVNDAIHDGAERIKQSRLDAIDQQIQDTRRLKQSYEQQLTSQGSY